jgi:AcrR family transcriptional regulator
MSRTAEPAVGPPGESDARDRILETAYELFSHRGIRGVGVDEIIQRAGVAKATLYRHFPSKDDLVIAFLDLRERRWSQEFVEAEVKRRGATPEAQLLAYFDVFDEWFHEDDFEACSFINVLLEMGPEHPATRAAIDHLANIRSGVRDRAVAVGLRDPEAFAHSFQILLRGAIIAAAEGDLDAARRAASIARLLIDAHR